MIDIINMGRAVPVGAAESLDLRDVIEGQNASRGEAKGVVQLFGQSA